jgi:hypothetical protein
MPLNRASLLFVIHHKTYADTLKDLTPPSKPSDSDDLSDTEHPRDPRALLSLREVLRHKVPVDGLQSAQSSSITVSHMANNTAPPSAWAKPAVKVNMAAVDGQVRGIPEAVASMGIMRIIGHLR